MIGEARWGRYWFSGAWEQASGLTLRDGQAQQPLGLPGPGSPR